MAPQTSRAWSIGAGLAALLTYLWLAPYVAGDGDSSELTLALARNGVAHPPGYPLYVLAGHAFVVALHAAGATWAFAANAWSALGAAMAIGCMHALCVRLVPSEAPLSARARGALALIPVTLFGINPVWTHMAALAEVYSWHQAWVMAAALAFVSLARSGTPSEVADARTDGPRRMLAPAAGWGMLCGLGLAHHPTSVLIFVPLGIALIAVYARGGPSGSRAKGSVHAGSAARFAVVAMVAALVPVASYASLYVKANHPDPAVWIRLQPGWASVWAHATAAQYHGYLGAFAPLASQQRQLARYVFPYLLPALVLMGVMAWRARPEAERRIAGALLAAALLQASFSLVYGVTDPASYFIPALGIALAMLVPLGVSLAELGPSPRRLIQWGALALGVATALQLPLWLGIGAGRRDLLIEIDQRIRRMWLSIPFGSGIVLWGGDLHHRMNAYQLLLHERPGLHLVSPYELAVPMSGRRFAERFGFDPFDSPQGARFARPPSTRGPEYDAFLDDIARRLHRTTHQPVVVLSPSADSLRIVADPTARDGSLGSRF